jgi:hypothetical protein
MQNAAAVTPMRNKLIAHLSLEDFDRHIIGNVTKGTEISIFLAEAVLFLFYGSNLQIETLSDDAKLEVKSLLRSHISCT